MQAAERLVKIALRNSEWVWVRARSLKYLRRINLPVRYISDLDALLVSTNTGILVSNDTWIDTFTNIFQDKVNLRSELERTVYELINRAREEARESPDEKYLATLVNRGKSLYKDGYYPEALIYLKQAITLNGQYAPAFALCGEIHLRMANYPESLDALNHALLNNAQDASIFALRGEVYLWMGLLQEAVADLTQAIQLKKEEPQFFAHRGYAQMSLDHYQEALVDFNQALALDEQFEWAFVVRGETHRLMGNYPEALADFTKAITFNEGDDWNYYCRALTYLSQGLKNPFNEDMQSAIRCVHILLATEQDSWRLKFNLALYKLVNNEDVDAQMLYDQHCTSCKVVQDLQDAVEDIATFLIIQPSHQLARQICTQLQDCIDKLKSSS